MFIILASGSPRRQQLLSDLGIDFEVRLLQGIDESYPQGLTGQEIAHHISRSKAEAYKASMAADELIITADTIVFLDSQVLGKPKNRAEAIAMLHRLSGRTHEVITGVTLQTTERQKTFDNVTRVTFCPLTDEEIEHYVDACQPLDKAGAYGIQEWIGYIGVERIEGCYYNVMGLPIQQLYRELKTFIQ